MWYVHCVDSDCSLESLLKIFLFLFLAQEYKSALTALNKAVSGASVDDFLAAAENALESCEMILKKVDKKKDR